jgi:hypothetical protein
LLVSGPPAKLAEKVSTAVPPGRNVTLDGLSVFGPLVTRSSNGFPVTFTVTATLIPSTLQPPARPLKAGIDTHDVVAVETGVVSQASSWPLTGLVTEPLAKAAAAGSSTSPAAPARTGNFRMISSRIDIGATFAMYQRVHDAACRCYRAAMGIPLGDEALRLLDGRNYAVLATVNPDGSPRQVSITPDVGRRLDTRLSWKYEGKDPDEDRPGASPGLAVWQTTGTLLARACGTKAHCRLRGAWARCLARKASDAGSCWRKKGPVWQPLVKSTTAPGGRARASAWTPGKNGSS